MKVLIVYYSQTGNTQRVAHSIQDGVRSKGHEVYVSALKNTTYAMLEQYDLIGIGSPVWMADPPPVRRFIEGLPQQNGKHAFVFNTHGTLPALFMPVVVGNLSAAGFAVVGWADWYGDCSIQVFPSPYYTGGHPDAQDLAEAEAFGARMCQKSEDIHAGRDEVPPTPGPENIPPMQAVAVTNMLCGTRSPHCGLRRDAEKCLYPKCGICEANCPMGYIDLENGKYGMHGDRCGDGHGCTYCEMLCPTGAIYADPPFEVKAPVGAPNHRGLFEQTLDAAEEAGSFRRIVPKDEIGYLTPYYHAHPKHPRIKPLSTKGDNS